MKRFILRALKVSRYSVLMLMSACSSFAPQPIATSGINLDNIDHQVRPQDNFYQYVNGHWLDTHQIPSDKTAIGAFSQLNDEADHAVKSIIENLAEQQNLSPGSDQQKVADLFRSYMNQPLRQEKKLSPITPLLIQIEALKTKDELAYFIGKNQAIGLPSPLQLYISVDAKNSTAYAAHVWQGGLGLPDKDYYENKDQRFENIRLAYLQYIKTLFELANWPEADAAAEKIIHIETQLAAVQWSRVQSRDSEKRYNKLNRGQLKKLSPNFSWRQYLLAQGLAQQNDIIINQPDFVSGFDQLFAQTRLADWKLYFKFHSISQFSPYLSTGFEQANFNFYSKTLYGRNEQRPLWKRGVNVVNEHLGEVVGKIYVAQHFEPQAKMRMNTLVENLRGAFSQSINTLEWMSDETKTAAQIKLAAFTPKIGYPDKWQDYSQLTIKADDLIGNIMRSGDIYHQKQLAKLGGPIQKWEWGMTPQTVNAYYNPTVNEIVFPAAILQPPFFNMQADDAVNYGGIGAVIGHEMGHGFDDQGSKYDAQGNLKNWWLAQDLKEFKKRTQALVQQYQNYAVFDDLTVNGELTLGENIGDLSGVTIAYKAYKSSLKGKEAPIIDGLTGDQRFFMGYAQVWRNKTVEKSLRNRVATDPHSPAEFRTLGALSNVDAFYDAFNVQPGDKMYIAPEKRVKIW